MRASGVERVAAYFCLRLCYSVKSFVMAFPTTGQECFLAGHVSGLQALAGVPPRRHRTTTPGPPTPTPDIDAVPEEPFSLAESRETQRVEDLVAG